MSIFKTFLKVLKSVVRDKLTANYPLCSTEGHCCYPWVPRDLCNLCN